MTFEGTEHSNARILSPQGIGLLCDHQQLSCPQNGADGETVTDAIGETPTRQVDVRGASIEQLQPASGQVAIRWMVLDFVDDDILLEAHPIGSIRRHLRRESPRADAIRESSLCALAQDQGVDHRLSIQRTQDEVIAAFWAKPQCGGWDGSNGIRLKDGTSRKGVGRAGGSGLGDPQSFQGQGIGCDVGNFDKETHTRRTHFVESEAYVRGVCHFHDDQFCFKPKIIQPVAGLMQFHGQSIRAWLQAAARYGDFHRRRNPDAADQCGGVRTQSAGRQVAAVDLAAVQIEGGPVVISGPKF